MRLVVDANVLFSALIKDGKSSEMILNLDFELYMPKFVLVEFEKHREEILRKCKRSEKEFYEILDVFYRLIRVVGEEDYGGFISDALKVCPDENDADYFALALKLGCGVWSQDKELKKQDVVKVFSTEDLIGIYS